MSITYAIADLHGRRDLLDSALERITQPGTLGLILTGNAREKLEKGPPVVTEEELHNELGKLFQIVKLREFRFDPIRGPEDKPLGWSCLVKRL